jgi:hydrogenase nickel incorporation protein HypA/HybF
VHELSIAQNVLDIVLEEGRKHEIKQVLVIKLQIGALAAVVPDALTFCFEMLSQNTMAAGASLVVEILPVVARCKRCDEHFEVIDHDFSCPQCRQATVEMVSGRELTVASIEGETGE